MTDDAPTVVAPPLMLDEDDGHRRPTSEPAVVVTPIEVTGEALPSRDPSEAKVVVSAGASESGPNPFDDAVWRREGGSDADVEIAGAHPIVGANPVREAIGSFAKNKRNLAIAGGAVVLLVVVIGFAMSGNKPSASKQASAKKPAKAEPAAKPTPVETPVETPAETPPAHEGSAAAQAPSEGSDSVAAAEHDTPSEHESTEHATTEHATTEHATTEKPKPRTPTLGGKQVVLEYDTQAREGKPVPNAANDDQAAIGKARTSYAAGNTRLFAGDADGAIKNYKQALGYYPAYVAAYRGLGLAYAQKGDNPAAAKALRTYVSAAPGAKDAAIIRKRIQTLK